MSSYVNELFLNHDEVILENQMDRLDKVMHEYLILQKQLLYGRDLDLEKRDSIIEAIRNMQQMIDHLWQEVLMVADSQIARRIRETSSPQR